jgi:hypothetical protein
MTGGDSVARLPSALQAAEPAGREPVRQYREGLPAVPANSAAYPNALALVVVTLTQTQSMADNSVVNTDGASPRQEIQRDHPRVDVVFRLRQCDKDNQGWREGPPLTVACQSLDPLAGPSPSG